MEVYILDSLLRRTQVVDDFESFIWTERFSDVGDCEIIIKSNQQTRNQFIAGVQLAINNSYRVMTVETVEDTTDTDGKKLLKIKGYSGENVLGDRIVKGTMSDLTTEPKWILTGTPGDIARQMFNDICIDGNLDPLDVIPFIMTGTIFPADTIAESADVITVEQTPDTLLNAIKNLCSPYDLGFRLVRNFDNSQLYFDIYSGSDRTTQQTILPPVVFSPNLDNLQNTTEYSTIQKSKNVAYVFSDVGYAVVYGPGVDPDVEGFERRVLLVNATDVTVETTDIPGALQLRGTEELLKNRALSYFDGETSQYSDYTYGVDYQLGDIVELRNVDGVITYKRVTEQIFVHDGEGERSYPTLTMALFTSTMSWLSYLNKLTAWEDMTTEHWDEM